MVITAMVMKLMITVTGELILVLILTLAVAGGTTDGMIHGIMVTDRGDIILPGIARHIGAGDLAGEASMPVGILLGMIHGIMVEVGSDLPTDGTDLHLDGMVDIMDITIITILRVMRLPEGIRMVGFQHQADVPVPDLHIVVHELQAQDIPVQVVQPVEQELLL